MCGLSGVLLLPGRRAPEVWAAIREIVRGNLVFSEERGRDASGVAVVSDVGELILLRRPVPATVLVESDEFRGVMDHVGQDTTCVLAHTRHPTKGSPSRNANNHPIPTRNLVGVHNGHIDNDDRLFATLRMSREGEVDSEVIFRLLDDPVAPLACAGRISELAGKVALLEGTFATLSVDLRAPTWLLALKWQRPLCLHYEERHRALYFSSRYIFLRKAFGRSVITEALDSDHGYLFDADSLVGRRSSPVARFPILTAVRDGGGASLAPPLRCAADS